jgi:hypothetical protein
MRNVARAWAYETGVVVGEEIGPGKQITITYKLFAYTTSRYAIQ